MELLCPQCQKQLTIADQYAGQMMRCPLCNGTFTAPTLTVTSPPPSLPEKPGEATAFYAGAPPLPPAPVEAPTQVPPAVDEELTPPSPGDYRHSSTIWISPRVVPWIAPACLLVIFVLTFLPWESSAGFLWLWPENAPLPAPFGQLRLNAWQLGFPQGHAVIGAYLILFIVALVTALLSALVSLRFWSAPPALKKLGLWRVVAVAGVTTLALLLLLVRYIDALFVPLPATIWFRLAFWIHLAAALALLLEVWLRVRRRKDLPLPRVEFRW